MVCARGSKVLLYHLACYQEQVINWRQDALLGNDARMYVMSWTRWDKGSFVFCVSLLIHSLAQLGKSNSWPSYRSRLAADTRSSTDPAHWYARHNPNKNAISNDDLSCLARAKCKETSHKLDDSWDHVCYNRQDHAKSHLISQI